MSENNKQLLQQQRPPAAERLIRPAGKSVYEKEALAAMSSHGGASGFTTTNSRPAPLLIIDESEHLRLDDGVSCNNSPNGFIFDGDTTTFVTNKVIGPGPNGTEDVVTGLTIIHDLPNFIASLPMPDSMKAVEQIKAAVKKYRSSLPTTAEGEKRLSLAQTYHHVAQAKGFKCWDALVAVAARQDEARLPSGAGQMGSVVISDDEEFQDNEEFCCPECDSFDVSGIEYEDDFGSMRCNECEYQGSPGEHFPSKSRFKPLSPIARKLYSFIKNKSVVNRP